MEMRSIMELRRRFFKYHTQLIDDRPVAVEPLTLILNPSQFQNDDPSKSETWYAIYCRGYYVTIQQSYHSPINGPHVAKLYIQVPSGDGTTCGSVWLGTAQLDRGFFSDSEIRIGLRKAIRRRDYFCSEETERLKVSASAFGGWRDSQISRSVPTKFASVAKRVKRISRKRTLAEQLADYKKRPRKNLADDLRIFHQLYHGKIK